MDFGGIFDKVTSNAGAIGTLAGVLVPLEQADGLGIVRNAQIAVEKHDIKGAFAWLTDLKNYTSWGPGADMMKIALALGIGGYALEELAPSNIGKFGAPMQKAAWGIIVGLPVAMIILGLGRDGGADHGLKGGSHFGFLSGSRHNPHGAYSEPTKAPYGTNVTRSAASSANPYT